MGREHGASSNMLFPDLGAEYANRVCKSFHLERLGKLYTNSVSFPYVHLSLKNTFTKYYTIYLEI